MRTTNIYIYSQLTQLLNEFMNDPVLLNRIEYPYACCGFICQNVATSYAGDKVGKKASVRDESFVLFPQT